MSILPKPKRWMWVWYLWLVGFLSVWAWLVFGNSRWPDVVEHWPIALTMALGSYVAGSTPMGGGTVAFPILVLLYELPATLGRDFSFAVQSIGMTSASIFILARRQPLALAPLKGAIWGTLIGLPIGIFTLAPLVPELWIKIIFSIVWASFGILHLRRINEISGNIGITDFDERWDFKLGLIVGGLSSAGVAAITGVGSDMVLYAALVLLCRADLKITIPTSVILMAFASVYGVAIKSATTGFQAGVYENWLAAAPIVAFGAPLGALMVDLIGRKPTLLFVSILCVGQFVWTFFVERSTLGIGGIAIGLLGVALFLLIFEHMRDWGARLVMQRAVNKTV